MPDAERRTRPPRAARLPIVAIVLAALLLLGLSCYGIAGPFVVGHHGFHAGEYSVRARHTIRNGSILPGNNIGWAPPRHVDHYLHHPILTHQLVTLTFAVLGEREYAVRGAALLAYLASFLFLVLLVRRCFGPWQAALAALTYVLVPINIWYGTHIDVGLPSIACVLAFFYFYFGWLESGRRRDAVLALLCAGLACGFEWSPYLCAVPIFLHMALVGLRRRGGALAMPLLYAAVLILPLAAHLLIALKTGHKAEMLASYHLRSRDTDTSNLLREVGERARLMYGPVMTYVMVAWAGLQFGRLLTLRGRARDLIGLSFLFALVAYVRLFPNGVLIHTYRFFYGNVVCAVAVVDLTEAAGWLAGRLWSQGPARWRAQAGASLATAAALLLSMVRPAAGALVSSRLSSGNAYLRPTVHDPQLSRAAFADAVRRATRPGDVVYAHATFSFSKELAFYLDRDERRYVPLAPPPEPERARAVLLCTPDGLTPGERRTLAELARQHPVWQVDRHMMIDLRQKGPSIRVDRLRPPGPRSWLSRYLHGPYVMPALQRDPAAEARYAAEFGLAPPASAPRPPAREAQRRQAPR